MALDLGVGYIHTDQDNPGPSPSSASSAGATLHLVRDPGAERLPACILERSDQPVGAGFHKNIGLMRFLAPVSDSVDQGDTI